MDPKQCFKNVIAGVPWAYLCFQTRFRNWCTDSVHLLQIKPALPTSKSLDYIASGLLGPTSGLPCQPANHWNTLLRAYSVLPRAYLCQPANHWNTLLCNLCYAIFAVQSLLCNICCAIFAMQSLLGNLCYRNLCGPTSGLPLPTSLFLWENLGFRPNSIPEN